jgi:hypothetical protein
MAEANGFRATVYMTTTNDNCIGLMSGTLVRPVPRYPASVVTDASLKVAANRIQASLVGSVGVGDTLLTFADVSRLVPDMLLSLDSEIVSITSISGNVATVVRGFDGTQPACHSSGTIAAANTVAYHHNALVAEVEAIEQALGPNLSNIGGATGSSILAGSYDFAAQTPGGTLIAGTNVITLNPVPRGVSGTDKHHWLWIDQGTGTPEACLITGGTAVSGAVSGTVIVNCAFPHSGAWRISSATAGIEEALNLSRYVAEARRTVTIHAPIWLDSVKELYAAPLWGVEIIQASVNTDCVWIGDDGLSESLGCVLRGFSFSTASGTWSSGWAINVRCAGFVEIRDCYVYANSLIWGGINLYRVVRGNLWNNYISRTQSHGVLISGRDAGNQSMTCNLIHCEFVSPAGNPVRVGDYAQGLSFRDCIFNGCVTDAISFSPATFTSGVNVNYFISECDIEGAGIYAQNVANLQIVNNWLSAAPALSSLKLAASVDTVVFVGNLITGAGGATSVPLIDNSATNVLISGNSINGGGTPLIPVLVAVGAAARKTTITGNLLFLADKCVQINAAAADTSITGNTFTNTTTPVSGKGSNRYVTQNKGIDDQIPGGMTATATITPLNPVVIVVGTTAIDTITVPDTFSGPLTLLPGNPFTWTAAGNIRVAGTAVVGKALTLVWDYIDAKWWPSYT